MPIYLVQHGLSNPKEVDPDRRLTEEGAADVTRIAGVAKGYSVKVAKILHSGKERARMTAEIFAKHLLPPLGVAQIDGINPDDDVISFAQSVDPDSGTMYVGHLPFMQKLASFLVSGNDRITVFKFQNGGIVCLDRDVNAKLWHIKWALMPRVGQG